MGPDQGPDKQQIVTEAVMTKGVEQTTAPASVEQTIGRSIRNRLKQGGDPREALRIATTPEVSGRKIAEKAEQIGVERDSATGAKVRNAQEQQRYDRVNNAAEFAQKIIDQGYDKLTTAEKTNLRNGVIDLISRSPLLAEKYRAMSSADRNKYVLALIKDPSYAAEIRTVIKEIVESDDLPDLVTDTQDKISETDLERTAKQAEVDDVKRRVSSVDTRLKSFERPAGGAAMGAKAQELENLRNNLAANQAALETANVSVQEKAYRLQQLESERQASLGRGATTRPTTEIDAEVGGVRVELMNAQREAQRLQAEIGKIPQLEEEERNLEEQKRNLGVEQREREMELGKINLELAKRQRNYQNALSLRESQELDLVEAFEGTPQEAALRILNRLVDEASDEVDATIEEWKKTATTQTEKAILDKMESMHKLTINKRRWGKNVVERKLDKAGIMSDRDTLLNNGAEAYMTSVLLRTNNPETGAVYTADEIAKIMQDEELAKRLQPKMIEPLLSRAMMVGSLSNADLYFISQTEWGKGMVDSALASNKNFRNNLAQYAGEGVIDQPGFMKRFSNELGGQSLLALILTGVVGLPVLAAIKAAKSGNIYT